MTYGENWLLPRVESRSPPTDFGNLISAPNSTTLPAISLAASAEKGKRAEYQKR